MCCSLAKTKSVGGEGMVSYPWTWSIMRSIWLLRLICFDTQGISMQTKCLEHKVQHSLLLFSCRWESEVCWKHPLLSIQSGSNTSSSHNITAPIPRCIRLAQCWSFKILSTHSSISKLCFLFLWHRAIVLEVCFAPAHVLTLPSVLAAAASRNQQWRQMWKHTDTLAECDTGRNNSTPFLEPTHQHATAAPFNNSTPTFAHVATIHRHFYIRCDTQGEGREVANQNNPVSGGNSPSCQVPQIISQVPQLGSSYICQGTRLLNM